MTPIVDLITQLLGPMLMIVFAAGTLYCVVLGVKYAKADEPQEQQKAKSALKNAIIGFILIFVLIATLYAMKKPMIDWVNDHAGKPGQPIITGVE